ncbi:hypothetical protein [Pseudomonas orientalis]|uniref:hypothetical protein n=1 Tax=Pseudomonas orientalis TaxID=76758 RepID=UPI000A045C42|nr:hypothetical protein [Pseudomonas orientalis]
MTTTSPPQGFDKWGATYVTDEQMVKAKYIQEGWLTPDEAAHLDEWVKDTSWMERAAGRELSVSERARKLTEMGEMLLTNGWGNRAPKPGISTGKVEGKGPGISADADGFGLNGPKGINKIFEPGRTPKASELKQYAEAQGWKPTQTDGGPLKYLDANGIPRVTIKQGSSRAPGSADPHVEFKSATGQRTDAFGNPVTRKSPDNHTSIDFDL